MEYFFSSRGLGSAVKWFIKITSHPFPESCGYKKITFVRFSCYLYVTLAFHESTCRILNMAIYVFFGLFAIEHFMWAFAMICKIDAFLSVGINFVFYAEAMDKIMQKISVTYLLTFATSTYVFTLLLDNLHNTFVVLKSEKCFYILSSKCFTSK